MVVPRRRSSEVLRLPHLEEIDEAGGVIRLSPGRSKTLVGRTLPISPPIADALDRRRARRDPTSPLVFHRDGIPRPPLAHGVAHRLSGGRCADPLPPRLPAVTGRLSGRAWAARDVAGGRTRGRVPGLRGGHQGVPSRAAPKWCPRGHVPMAAEARLQAPCIKTYDFRFQD